MKVQISGLEKLIEGKSSQTFRKRRSGREGEGPDGGLSFVGKCTLRLFRHSSVFNYYPFLLF